MDGLSEVYSWYELQAGARWSFLRTARSEARVEARVVRTAAPRIVVEYAGADVALDLGVRTGWRLGGDFRRAVGPRAFVTAGAWAEGYAFGASAVDRVYWILEPASETVNVALDAGVGVRF